MNKKVLRKYIINAVISGIYSVIGSWNLFSTGIKKHILNIKIKEQHESAEGVEGLVYLFEDILHIFKSIANDIIRFVFGYIPLFVGIIAIALSSIGVLYFMKGKTQKTIGYHITMIFSYSLLSILTIIYLFIAGIFYI